MNCWVVAATDIDHFPSTAASAFALAVVEVVGSRVAGHHHYKRTLPETQHRKLSVTATTYKKIWHFTLSVHGSQFTHTHTHYSLGQHNTNRLRFLIVHQLERGQLTCHSVWVIREVIGRFSLSLFCAESPLTQFISNDVVTGIAEGFRRFEKDVWGVWNKTIHTSVSNKISSKYG